MKVTKAESRWMERAGEEERATAGETPAPLEGVSWEVLEGAVCAQVCVQVE